MFSGGSQPPQEMAIAAEAAEAPVPSPTPPSSSGTPRPVLPPVSPRPVVPAAAAAATTAEATATATAATATRTGRVRNFVIPPWRGAARGNTDTATAPTQAAAVVNRTDTVTPPPPITAPEAARPSPTSTTDALPTLEEEPRARESRTATVRTFVIPPWRGAARDNSATAAARTRAVVVDCPDTVATPPPPITAPEAARPSPISTTDARPTLEEEPRARESRAARVRAYVIPPWRDNSATAATATPATAAVVNRTDTATPPPTTTASEAARPSPISTADARPTLEEEPRARESGTASVRIFVIPPWRGAARDNSATAAARTRAVVVDCPDTVATPPPAYTASEAARPSPISTADARPTLEEPRAIEARTTRLRNYVIPPWAGASRNNSATAATATAATATTATATAATAAVVNRTDTATPPLTTTASEAARPSPISTTDARPTTLEEPRARESRTARGVRTYVIPPWAGASRVNRTTAAAPPTRAGERQLTRGEAQAILDAADMAAAEEVVAANEAADAFAVAQAVAASESAGAPSETGSETGGRSAEGGGDGGRISLALHHRVRQARDRASSTSSEQVLGHGRDTETRLESGWRTDGDVRVGRGGVPRVQQGRRLRLASSSSEQTTVRASDAETELDSGSLTDVDERHIVLVQQDRVTLPRERAGSVSSEQATLRASDVDMELDSGSQTEGDEGGDGDGDGGGCVLLVQERVRLPRGRTTTRRSRNYARGNAKDDASSTAVAAVATESARRTQSCPPTLERPPPPPAAHAVDGEPGDAHTAASGSEVGEPTSPTTQAAATQTDMEEEEAPESPAAEVADAQTETEEEGVESPTAQQVAAEAETEEDDGEVAVEAEAEAEAGGVALGGSGGVSVFPIVREDPDAGAVAFRSDSCAECQSLVVDASAHRDAVGMKGKVSAGLNADRCRNCWRVVCDSCVGTFWARTMVPQMYTRDSDSHRMRVCKTCHCAMEMFRKALLLGRVEEAMAAYGTGCVNLDTPYTTYHGELPVHCAAAGGNVVLLSWLVDELGCSLFVDEDLKKPLRDLRNLTVLGAAAVNAQVQTMRYLVNTKRCSLFEITHLPTMKKALEACLHVSPEAKFSLGARGSGSSGQQSTEITTDVSLRADGERSSYVDRGGPIEVSTMFGAASAFDDEDDCCIVCFDNEVACTLVPCGHHCCCRDCAGRLNHCPVCRARITEMIKAIPV